MHLLSAFLLGIATNLDNLLLGIVYGLQNKRITPLKNFVIALCSGVASFICCYAASFCQGLGRWPNYIGSALLISLGVWPLLPKRGSKDANESPDTARASGELSVITWGETCTLGGALALNCLAASFAAGLTGVGALPLAGLVAACSFIAVWIGNAMGLVAKVGVKSNRLNWLACGMMIAMGILGAFA